MNVKLSKLDVDKIYLGRKQFDCEHDVINKFVHDSLVQQVRKNLSVAYVLTDQSDKDRFVGFYTIAQHAIDCSLMAKVHPGSLPRMIPCLRLIMLGVDKNYKKQKLGLRLMKHAFSITKSAAQEAGCFGLYLDADPQAIKFYQDIGFSLLEGDKSPTPSPMFLPLSAIA